MDFHYYYLVQDIIGVLLAFLALKMLILFGLKIYRHGLSIKYSLCLIGNIMLLWAGINFMISPWGVRTWTISFMLSLIGLLFGRFAYNYSITK
ncbi:hypothetical protein A2V47_03460 [Candidatus Atribacteria bacterium RBG_19FT_COMBO_35_14]|uniref:Uncharacterized protein n=1 Tax=Candidatus Sediminicultor quintus TaxID=1797291 RepID=A0A1F5ADB6_9BACT|nr:MAG: hypothetical protein A2V47_03460 [Candidatus Atribacteria bacterium RBG_19FT_COMBO_35_14]